MYSAHDVAKRINDQLKVKGLSQKEMLDKCGLSKNAISSMISRGSMLRADNIAKIADYIGCSVDYLLYRSDDPTNVGSSMTNADKQILDDFHKLSSRDQREIKALISIKLDESKKDNLSSSQLHQIDSLAN